MFVLFDQQKWTDEHAELPEGYLVYPSSKVSAFLQSILEQCSEGAEPSCSANTLINKRYASLLEAAMRYPDKHVNLLTCFCS